ncbi:MAG: PAS domain S-box protein, partial [Spirochaetes bacterium]|nr:PAS domain S-box protein [Spirochaetota bacterium]
INRKGIITSVNTLLVKTSGYSIDKYIGMHFSKINVFGEQKQAIPTYIKIFNSALKGKTPKPFIVTWYHKDGSLHWSETYISIIKSNKLPSLFLVSFRDITEKIKTENALKKSEQTYREIFNNSSDAIFVHDLKTGKIVDANKVTCQTFGYSQNEIKKLAVGDLSINKPPYTTKEAIQWIEKAAKEGPQYFEWLAKDRKGNLIWRENSLVCANVAGIDRVLVFSRNINKRRKAEEALKKSEELYRNLFETSLVGLWRTGITDGKFINANKTCADIVGVESAEELIKKYKTSDLYPPKKRAELIAKLKKEGFVTNYEIHCTMADKSEKDIAISAKIYPDNDYIEGALIDITERKKLQEQLIQSEKLAAVGQMVSGIAHEFNNLLTIIQGTVELAKLSEGNNKKIIQCSNTIEKQTKRGADIVNTMMAYIRSTVPKKELSDIGRIINEVLKLQKRSLNLENINVIKKYNNKNKIMINRNQFQQVFLNLIINARHAIKPKKKGTLKIIINKDKKNMFISIQDNGTGIDDKIKKSIFNPFFTTKRTKASDKFGIKGTGLGLSVTYTIIKNHNGTISVDSRKNEGTSFMITLPVTGINKETKTSKKTRKNIYKLKKAKELNILIIDDEKAITSLLRNSLKKHNFKNITTSNSGKKSLDLFRQRSFDTVFLDMLLPDMEGEEILKEMKKIDPHVPVIFFTGQIGIELDKLKNKNVYEIIHKPFKIAEVIELLNNIVRDKKREKAD